MAKIDMDYTISSEDEELVRQAQEEFRRTYSRFWSEKRGKIKPLRKTPRAYRAKVVREVLEKVRKRMARAVSDGDLYDMVDTIIIEHLRQLKRLASEGYTIRYLGIGKFYSIKGELGFKAAPSNEEDV